MAISAILDLGLKVLVQDRVLARPSCGERHIVTLLFAKLMLNRPFSRLLASFCTKVGGCGLFELGDGRGRPEEVTPDY